MLDLCTHLKKLHKEHTPKLKQTKGNNKRTGIKWEKKLLIVKICNCLLVLCWPVVLEILATASTIAFSFLEHPTDV